MDPSDSGVSADLCPAKRAPSFQFHALDAFAEAFFLHTVEGHNRVKKVRMNS
ncbi:unnamed protein product [Ascophyllum nodosum]